ncbi:MAG: alkaline phosphatase family protein [Caulobacter sp.]|nr:alkaline phosphatase family protein [Caulobacter sp.]
MPRPFRLCALFLLLLVAACAGVPTAPPPPQARLTLLVSIDGFRADYLDRGVTPTLSGLAADGARGAMRPSFPSLTFPNHYTLVTGKRPDRNGIVDNVMQDADIPGVTFTMSNHAAVIDPRWWDQATPIWVSAEQQGVRTGTMFWPGSEAAIHGVRPTRWAPFVKATPATDRVDGLLAWLDAPGDRPLGLGTLYFDIVDTAGHHYGPDSAEVNAAAAEVDAALARLVAGLKARGLYETTNLVVVADHGMAPLPAAHRILLDEILDVTKVKLVGVGAVTGVFPEPGAQAEVAAALLRPHPHMTCWPKAKIPARFHFGTNPRIAPIVCLSETGWYTTTIKRRQTADEWDRRDGGAHGFDPYDPRMRAVFVARGPAFRSGVTLPVFDNVDVYPLVARAAGVRPEAGDWRLADVKAALR